MDGGRAIKGRFRGGPNLSIWMGQTGLRVFVLRNLLSRSFSLTYHLTPTTTTDVVLDIPSSFYVIPRTRAALSAWINLWITWSSTSRPTSEVTLPVRRQVVEAPARQ